MTLLGNGIVYTRGQVQKDGKPLSIQITFTESALNGLREDVPQGNPRITGWEYSLKLPKEIQEKTPFDHVAIDWNPKGHIPPNIYDVPHFDFHFYMTSYEERSQITAEGED